MLDTSIAKPALGQSVVFLRRDTLSTVQRLLRTSHIAVHCDANPRGLVRAVQFVTRRVDRSPRERNGGASAVTNARQRSSDYSRV